MSSLTEMSGTWTETVSTATCPRCAAEGRSSRLTHYTTVENGLSILQQRCHTCRAVSTQVHDSSARGLAALRKAHRSGRSLLFAVIFGQLLAVGMLAAAASVLAAQR
jgi:hypothetical protein